MNTHEIEVQYCNKCPKRAGCGFLIRGLQSKCGHLSDYMEGYEAAIEKAAEWLKNWGSYRVCVEGRKDWFIEQFQKAMEQ